MKLKIRRTITHSNSRPANTMVAAFAGFVAALVVLATQSSVFAAGPDPVYLGAAAPFTILAGAAVTSTGGGLINGMSERVRSPAPPSA